MIGNLHEELMTQMKTASAYGVTRLYGAAVADQIGILITAHFEKSIGTVFEYFPATVQGARQIQMRYVQREVVQGL